MQTGQFTDASGDSARLVFVFWPLIDVFLHVYLNIYYASDSLSCIVCPHSLVMQLEQVLLPVASASYPVRELTSPRVV